MLRSVFLPAVLACAAAVFSPATASAQIKVGIVNFQRAVLGTSEMKKASNDLMLKYKPQQDELEKLQRDLAEIQAKLQDPKTPPAAGPDLQAEGQRKQREAKRITEDVQADAEKDRNDILQRATQRMTDVVKKLADEKGLDVVVDSANIVFFKPALEITEESIAAYDRTYPVK
ncbi:MAG TPA: OmpH family outer membrane protein [Bryobacteraceae bacterium]|nr:OmpH family outer membrane protein [Bryobacteraceae bacterium]